MSDICEVEGCNEYAARDICKPHQRQVRYWQLEPLPHWRTQPNPACHIEGCGRVSQSAKLNPPICKLHRDYERQGRPLETVREKMRNGSSDKPCSWEGCERQVRARGMCERHYYYLKRELKMDLCAQEGCERRSVNDWCHQHRPRAPRPVTPTGPCAIADCENEYQSWAVDICKTHNSARNLMGLSLEEYKAIRAETSCQVCGAEDRLVVDHWHGHHPENKWRMCKGCIRGVMCSRCNSALAFLFEDPKKIMALAHYAENVQPGNYFGGASGPVGMAA